MSIDKYLRYVLGLWCHGTRPLPSTRFPIEWPACLFRAGAMGLYMTRAFVSIPCRTFAPLTIKCVSSRSSRSRRSFTDASTRRADLFFSGACGWRAPRLGTGCQRGGHRKGLDEMIHQVTSHRHGRSTFAVGILRDMYGKKFHALVEHARAARWCA